jgi:hypothetical protein
MYACTGIVCECDLSICFNVAGDGVLVMPPSNLPRAVTCTGRYRFRIFVGILTIQAHIFVVSLSPHFASY